MDIIHYYYISHLMSTVLHSLTYIFAANALTSPTETVSATSVSEIAALVAVCSSSSSYNLSLLPFYEVNLDYLFHKLSLLLCLLSSWYYSSNCICSVRKQIADICDQLIGTSNGYNCHTFYIGTCSLPYDFYMNDL